MARRLGGTLGLPIAALLCTADVWGGDPARFFRVETPLMVVQRGPDPVRVRISTGRTLPCDSSSNRMLIDRRVESGEVVRTTALSNCVCFQQTYAPLADSDWSTPQRVCSPCAYNPQNRTWVCPPPHVDPTISIEVVSSRARSG